MDTNFQYGRALGQTIGTAAPKLAGNAALRSINAKLIQSERQLLDPTGLPKREWYRHLLYAPGYYTGYSVKTLPGVREGIEQKEFNTVEAEVVRVAAALDRESALIDSASVELEQITK